VGGILFVGLEAAMGTPEVTWIAGGLRHVHGQARRALGMATHG
jgi:hypothetical protein